jgi:DNA-binding GntR family transcriptional regulator
MHDVTIQAIIVGMLMGLILFLVDLSIRLSSRLKDRERELSAERHRRVLADAKRQGYEKQVQHMKASIGAAYERGKAEATQEAKPNRRYMPRLPDMSPDDPDETSIFDDFDFADPVQKGAA